RHDHVAKMIERHLVAEEERLVGRHRLDDVDNHPLRAWPLQLRNQTGEIEQTSLARDWQQTALDQIVLLSREHEAGPLLEQLAQEFIIVGRHERAPRNRRTTFGPI